MAPPTRARSGPRLDRWRRFARRTLVALQVCLCLQLARPAAARDAGPTPAHVPPAAKVAAPGSAEGPSRASAPGRADASGSPNPSASANASASATAPDGASKSPRKVDAGADAVDFSADAPPPTAYDRLGAEPKVALAPESLGLLRQLGRTVLALAATLALVYLTFKLLLPRLMTRLGPQGTRTLRLRERLVLDGKNSLVVVEHEDGRSWIVGCSDGAMVPIAATPAPPAGPIGAPAQVGHAAFADALADAPQRPAPGR